MPATLLGLETRPQTSRLSECLGGTELQSDRWAGKGAAEACGHGPLPFLLVCATRTSHKFQAGHNQRTDFPEHPHPDLTLPSFPHLGKCHHLLSCSPGIFLNVFLWLCQVLVVACRIYFPKQGLNPGPLHWEGGIVATGPPGKSLTKEFLFLCQGRHLHIWILMCTMDQ